MNRQFFFSTLFGFLLFDTAYACGDSHYQPAHPVQPGCERLQVVIHNETAYTFTADSTFAEVSSTGGAPIKSSGTFSAIAPGDVTLNFDGYAVSDTDRDKVDTSMRYSATINGQKVPPQFTLSLIKKSCNVQNADVKFDDDHCYDHYTWGDCSISCSHTCAYDAGKCAGGCSYCESKECISHDAYGNCTQYLCTQYTHNDDYVCNSEYRYDSVRCGHDGKNANNYQSYNTRFPDNYDASNDSAIDSKVTTNQSGIFTTGVNFESNGDIQAEDVSKHFGTYSNFTCNKSSVCNSSSNGNCITPDPSNPNGADTYNRPAKLEFYIKPSPVEKLTVHFLSSSTDAQTTVSHAILQSLYNNLYPKYLAQLGTFWSLTPVQINSDNKSITFSTLCNDASCKQVS